MMAFPKKLPQPDPSSYCHKLQQQQQDAVKEQQLLVSSNGQAKADKETAAKLNDASSKAQSKPSLKEFPSAVKRLLKNDILLCRTASSVLHILPIAGLYTFLPKYLESQFQLTASKANMISGRCVCRSDIDFAAGHNSALCSNALCLYLSANKQE